MSVSVTNQLTEEYVFLGGGGLALELYDCMSMEKKRIAGYYDLKENPKLSQYIPWLGDEYHATLNRKAHYVIASGIPSLRQKMIAFIEGY